MEDRPAHPIDYLSSTPRVYLRYKPAFFLFLAFIDIVCGLSEMDFIFGFDIPDRRLRARPLVDSSSVFLLRKRL